MSEDLESRCIWYKSLSIPKTNPTYKTCRECDGYNTKCIIYTSLKVYNEYAKDVVIKEKKELEEKMNEVKNNG